MGKDCKLRRGQNKSKRFYLSHTLPLLCVVDIEIIAFLQEECQVRYRQLVELVKKKQQSQ